MNKIDYLKTDELAIELLKKISDNLPDNPDDLKFLIAKLTSDWLGYIDQYCSNIKEKHKEGEYLLPHICMSAGEDLCETLEYIGVAEDDGHSIKINSDIVSSLGLNV